MRKNAAQPVTCLVSAHDVDPVETHLFVCTFDNMRWDTPREALRAAWKEWARQENLAAFIENNGTNWGDSTFIPSKVLRKAGIFKYENAIKFGPHGNKSIRVPKVDMEFDADHNEPLFDLEEFEKDPPNSLPAPKGAMCECCKTRPADRVYRVMGDKGKVISQATYCRPCFKSVFAPET
jgi:hypothetical protein